MIQQGFAHEQNFEVTRSVVVGVRRHTFEADSHHGRLGGRGDLKEFHVNGRGELMVVAEHGHGFDVLGTTVSEEVQAGYVGQLAFLAHDTNPERCHGERW